jgi:hypothetical protein
VRALIDHRPALRERSGVGEYTPELVTALLAAYPRQAANPQREVVLFSSSWQDRLVAAPERAGAAMIDRRIPVRVLNFAWRRFGCPPAEWLAGGAYDIAPSSHPLLPARAAAQVVTIHDFDFLSHPEPRGLERARRFRRTRTAHLVFGTYRHAIERRARRTRGA